jgi:glycerol-3-phosphate cytidylyltransferase
LARRVLAMGVFDLLHAGHLRYLRHARSRGGQLVVGVATEAVTWHSKHKRPVVPEDERLELVRSLRCVDEAWPIPCPTTNTEGACRWICEWRIDLVVVGAGWRGSERWQKLEPLLRQAGIRVEFAEEWPEVSTSRRIAHIVATHQAARPRPAAACPP